jgi:hypothetical protein
MRHEDSSRSGVPDISVTARGKTSWWEIKYGHPSFETNGIQHLTMLKLGRFGYARYVVFRETADGHSKQTALFLPKDFDRSEEWANVSGFNFQWVVDQIRFYHEHGQ